MTEAQAQFLAGKLAAAFARDWAFVGEATNAVYVEKVAKLDRYEAAKDAVDSLIESEMRLPPIALIREEYRRHWDRYSPPALAEPQIDDEQRETNIRLVGILAAHLARAEGHSGDFGSCEHPGCVELRSVAAVGQD